MRKAIKTLALLAALSAGVFASSPVRADGDSCCKPGATCCKPDAPCCKK